MISGSNRMKGHALALFTVFVWGSTLIASKMLLTVFTPLQIMVMRFAMAYLVLWLIKPKWLPIRWRDELGFLLMGLLGGTCYFLCENTALTFTLAANVGIILSAVPIFTAILAHFFTRDEKFRKNMLFGSLLAFVGVALAVFNGTVVLKLNPLGDCLALLGAFCWASYSMILKRYAERFHAIVLARKIMFYGFITSLPVLLAEGQPFVIANLAEPYLLLCILFLGLIGSGLCSAAWGSASKRIGIVTTSNYIFLNPFITMVMARLFLNEPISWMGIAGAVLIIVGILLCGKKEKDAPVIGAEAS